MYVYQAIVETDEDGVLFGAFNDFNGCFASGKTVRELATELGEALRLTIAEYLDSGLALPESFLSIKENTLTICVDVTTDFIERTKCMTVSEAADELGLTKGRISQLLSAGKLQAVEFGNERLVTIASVNARKAERPKAGRPQKAAVSYGLMEP